MVIERLRYRIIRREAVSRRDVVTAFRTVLERTPDAPVVEEFVQRFRTPEALSRALLGSREFLQKQSREAGRGAPAGPGTLIHLHIPKSAGSSLSTIIRRQSAPEGLLAVNDGDLARLRAMPRDKIRSLRFVFGHLSHGVAAAFPQRCTYITLLRDPEERLLSFFRYVQRDPEHPLHGELVRGVGGFGGFLERVAETGTALQEVDNGQIRRLAGHRANSRAPAAMERIFREALGNIFAPDMMYGLSEDLEGFLVRLRAAGHITRFKIIEKNKAPSPASLETARAELSAPQRALLDDFTAWDRRFYEICSLALSGQV